MGKLRVFSAFMLLLVLSVNSGAIVAQRALPEHQSVASSYLQAQAGSTLTDEEKIKNTIDSYFRLRYESQKLLEPQDFSLLATDDSQGRGWLQKERDKREIELFLASTYRLNYVKYEYFLEYDSIEIKGNKATVQLRRSHDVVYEAIAPEISKLFDLEHIITLRKTGRRWIITGDDYEDLLTPLLESEAKDVIIERVRRNHEAELQLAAEFASGNMINQQGDQPVTIASYHGYDRYSAVAYADRWARGRNTPKYSDFGANDCTNYASQVIEAGGAVEDKIPTDDNGNANIVWYYDSPSSYSSSWTNVGKMHEFLTNNIETGPYGYTTTQCNMDGGDVIQLLSATGWSHAVVVASTKYPERCWDLNYIWYNAHSPNEYHSPASYLNAYGDRRYIHVYGWGD